DSYIPPEKYALVHEAVLKACDVLDGVKDGVIENPTVCHFDPKVLVCKGADGPNCLTPAQAETARSLYAPVKNPKTGAEVMPALLQPGSELGWAILAGPEPIRYSRSDGVKDGVIENPTVCHFDPKVLVCKGADGPNCLTPAQAETARSLYAPVKNPKTGAEVMPALLQPGSELGWAILAGPEPIRYS